MATSMTLEQIEAHIDAANLGQFVKPQAAVEDKAAAALDLGSVLKSVCGVYKGIRPVIQAVVDFVFTPAKIKEALTTFMKVMDQICPG